MDMITFCKALCEELGLGRVMLPTGIWHGAKEICLAYDLDGDVCDVWMGSVAQQKHDLAKRMFLHLWSGIPSVRPKEEEVPP